jgi:pyridoxal 5'-phosphate synthase pdxS subunit
MSDPKMIKEIKAAVTIPVMAKVRIGHFVEAQILEAIGIDYIDESEVLTAADDENHIDKTDFNVPFVCGCRNIGEALRRVAEGPTQLNGAAAEHIFSSSSYHRLRHAANQGRGWNRGRG